MPTLLDLPHELLEQVLRYLSADVAVRFANKGNTAGRELWRQQSRSMNEHDLLTMLAVSRKLREITLPLLAPIMTLHLLDSRVPYHCLKALPPVITRNAKFLTCQSIMSEGPFSFDEHINVLFPNLQYVMLRETHTIYFEQSNELERIKKGFLEHHHLVSRFHLTYWRSLQSNDLSGTVSLKFDSRVRIFRMPDLVMGNAYPSIAYRTLRDIDGDGGIRRYWGSLGEHQDFDELPCVEGDFDVDN